MDPKTRSIITPKENKESRLQELEKEKAEAIASENYEKAASIRDEIKKIQETTEQKNEELQKWADVESQKNKEHNKEQSELLETENTQKTSKISDLMNLLNDTSIDTKEKSKQINNRLGFW